MTRRDILRASLALPLTLQAQPRKWQLGINTYCLRFQRWNDPQLWAEVRAWSKDTGLHLETRGSALTGAVNPKTPDARAKTIAELRMNIDRAAAMGSPIV